MRELDISLNLENILKNPCNGNMIAEIISIIVAKELEPLIKTRKMLLQRMHINDIYFNHEIALSRVVNAPLTFMIFYFVFIRKSIGKFFIYDGM